MPSYYYFRHDFLPTVMEKLHDSIEKLLNDAVYVTIIPDIWENNLTHYLGLDSTLVNDFYRKQIVVLGIKSILTNF